MLTLENWIVCDSVIQNPGVQALDAECNVPCSGDATQICGAGDRLSVYSNGAPPSTIPATIGDDWAYTSCFT